MSKEVQSVIKYKIEIDDSDLTQQLQNVRDAINSEMSNFTAAMVAQTPLSNAAPQSTFMLPTVEEAQFYNPPTAAPFINQVNGFPTTAPTMPGTADASGVFSNSASQTGALLTGFKDDLTLGTQKALADMSKFGTYMQNGLNKLTANSFSNPVSGIGSALGFGYDQRMPYSLADQIDASTLETGNSVGEFGETMTSFGLDVGLGISSWALAGIPVVGPWLAGGMAALTAGKTLLDLTTVDMASEKRELAKGIQKMGSAQFGVFSKADANEIVEDMTGLVRSKEGYLKDITMPDLEIALDSFASSGGFANTRSIDGFKQKITEVLENFREVMHVLGTTQEEAASIMGEFERRRLVSPDNFSSFAANMAVKGMYSGNSAMEMMQIGLNSADQYLGTGYGSMNAFNFGVDAAVEVGRLANSMDPYYRENIFELGGKDAATQKTIQMLATLANSPYGRNVNLGINATGNPNFVGQGPIDQLNTLGNILANGGPEAYFNALGKGMAGTGSLDFQTQAMGIVHQIFQTGKLLPGMLNAEGNMDINTFLGYGTNYLQQMGLNTDTETLKAILNIASLPPNQNSIEARVRIEEILNRNKSSQYSFGDLVNYEFGKLARGTGMVAAGEWLEGVYYDISKSLNRDAVEILNRVNGIEGFFAEDVTKNYSSVLLQNYLKTGVNNIFSSTYFNETTPRETTTDLSGLSDESQRIFYKSNNVIDEEDLINYLRSNEQRDGNGKLTGYKVDLRQIDRNFSEWNYIASNLIGVNETSAGFKDLTSSYTNKIIELNSSGKLNIDASSPLAYFNSMKQSVTNGVDNNFSDAALQRAMASDTVKKALRDKKLPITETPFNTSFGKTEALKKKDLSAQEKAFAKYIKEDLGKDPNAYNLSNLVSLYGTPEELEDRADAIDDGNLIENSLYVGAIAVGGGLIHLGGYLAMSGVGVIPGILTSVGGAAILGAAALLSGNLFDALGVDFWDTDEEAYINDALRKNKYTHHAYNPTSIDYMVGRSLLTGDSYENDKLVKGKNWRTVYNTDKAAQEYSNLSLNTNLKAEAYLDEYAKKIASDDKGNYFNTFKEIPLDLQQRAIYSFFMNPDISNDIKNSVKRELAEIENTRAALFENNMVALSTDGKDIHKLTSDMYNKIRTTVLPAELNGKPLKINFYNEASSEVLTTVQEGMYKLANNQTLDKPIKSLDEYFNDAIREAEKQGKFDKVIDLQIGLAQAKKDNLDDLQQDAVNLSITSKLMHSEYYKNVLNSPDYLASTPKQKEEMQKELLKRMLTVEYSTYSKSDIEEYKKSRNLNNMADTDIKMQMVSELGLKEGIFNDSIKHILDTGDLSQATDAQKQWYNSLDYGDLATTNVERLLREMTAHVNGGACLRIVDAKENDATPSSKKDSSMNYVLNSSGEFKINNPLNISM